MTVSSVSAVRPQSSPPQEFRSQERNENIQPWKVRYTRWDGGIAHAAKAVNSGWDAYLNDPDLLYASINLYDPKTVTLLQRMGYNWIYLTWSVGFSRLAEARSQEQATRYIQACHQADIRVTAYLSIANVFAEEIALHEPQLRAYGCVDGKGEWLTYGFGSPIGKRTRRHVCCVSHAGWRAYLLEKCRDAIAAGADALYFDNAVEGCVCNNCRKQYAEYVKQYWNESMAMPVLEPGWVEDVISEANQQTQQRWQGASGQREIKILQTVRQFERWRYDQFISEIDREAKKLNPRAFVYRNANLGMDCFRCGPAGVIITENASDPGVVQPIPPTFPGYEVNTDPDGRAAPVDFLSHIYQPGKLVNNVGFYAYLRAAADGKPVRAESQGRADGTQSRYVPPVPRRARLAMAEAAACGVNHVPHMDGGAIKEMFFQTSAGEQLAAAYEAYNAFFRRHESLYQSPTSLANCLVLVNDNTHSIEWLNRLAAQGVNFDVGFLDDLRAERLAQYKTIIVPDYLEWFPRKQLHYQPYLSDQALQVSVDFVTAGGSLYASAELGSYDQHLDPRRDLGLARRLHSMNGVHLFDRPGELLPDDTAFIAELLSRQKHPVAMSLPPGMLSVTWRVRDGRTVVHLLNYGAEKTGPIRLAVTAGTGLQAISPDGSCALRWAGDAFELEGIDIYTIVFLGEGVAPR